MTLLKQMTLKERFLNNIEYHQNSCWIWKGHVNSSGRSGVFQYKKKIMQANRASYEIFREKIPENHVIINCCNNYLCVNPDHLQAVTLRQKYERNKNTNKIFRKTRPNKYINNSFNWNELSNELKTKS